MKCPYCGKNIITHKERSDESMRLFYKLRDIYAHDQGLKREQAKRDLEHWFGVTVPVSVVLETMDVPQWRGEIDDYYGIPTLFKSLSEYEEHEMANLIAQTKREMWELGIDLDKEGIVV